MINFEEELKNFKPSLEVEEAEQAIYNHELTDMTDVLQEMMQEFKRGMQIADKIRKAWQQDELLQLRSKAGK